MLPSSTGSRHGPGYERTLIPSGLPLPFPSPNTQTRSDYFSAPIVPEGAWIEPSQQAFASTSQNSMASSHPQSFPPHPSMLAMDQHAYAGYSNQQSVMPNAFYDSFSILPPQMQMQMDGQQPPPPGMDGMQHHHAQLHPQHRHQGGMPSMLQPLSRQDSVEDDDEYEDEEDNSEVMIPQDDIETRLKVAQEAQDAAASEGPNGVFACPYCDKRYAGKHARSIWRRHLQDKHAIPLSQQPRRTRWDGDANRPKNAEERRQRMLESKRRWARKKRQAEKEGNKHMGEESQSEVSPTFSNFQDAHKASAQTKATKRRQSKPKGPQQIKFHNITQGEMPTFVDFGSSSSNTQSGNTGGGGMLWPTATTNGFSGPTRETHVSMGSNRAKPASGSTLSSAHNFHSQEAKVMNPHQQTFAMMTSVTSPRKVLAQIDTNSRHNGRTVLHGNGLMKGPQLGSFSPQVATLDMSKTTPLNRYSQLYPTPPSAGDAKMDFEGGGHSMLDAGKMVARAAPSFEHNGMPLLSPPASNHTGESSPSYFNGNALNLASLGKRSSSSSVFAPVQSHAEAAGQRSPANNPFSLDHHKISPTTGAPRRSLSDTLPAPPSASRLSTVMDSSEHRLSPLQVRGRADMGAKGNVSPLEKSRKLPPLVKTPLRPFKVEDKPTPSSALGFVAGGGTAGSASLRKGRSTGGDAWKALTTPTEEHSDRMLGGGAGLSGFTPFTIKSAKFSSTRGMASVSRSRNESGADQFSSPQHLNLTQSLGLAPHSTGKGVGGFGGSMHATPYIGSSFLSGTSPWPESIMRPTFKTSTGKRSRGGDGASENGQGSSVADDDEDEDDDGGAETFVHETPSRPAKHRRATLLGSEGSVVTTPSRLPSSASQEQYSMKPISFNLSSDREDTSSRKPDPSLDSDMTASKSSRPSTTTSSDQSDDGSSEVAPSPTMSAKKRSMAAK